MDSQEALFTAALERGAHCQRLTAEQALAVARADTPDQVHRLGAACLANRQQRSGRQATYVCNLQVNPSNICEGGCRFCRYAAGPGDEHAYVLDEQEILAQVAATRPSEVHIVGGLNQVWGYERNLALVRELRRRWSAEELYLKGYTAVEIDWFARQSGQSWSAVLTAFKEAGLDGLPGGGAEVFATRVRRRLCPEKLAAASWLAIHEQAHGLGLVTNATMLFGCGEQPEEQVEHLLAIRELQDRSGGFACFIALAHQAGEGGELQRPAPLTTLKVIGLARLVLDQLPHIKAYWPMIGLETAAAALSWGADDLDGTIGRERIAHAAGAPSPRALARTQMEETIRGGGFLPVERDGRFHPKPREVV